MKRSLPLLLLAPACLYAQQRLEGTVRADKDGIPLEGVTVLLKSGRAGTTTDVGGNFSLPITSLPDTLLVTLLGFEPREMPLQRLPASPLQLTLAERNTNLREVTVVSTGYQDIPQERATGSFTQVDRELLTRSTGQDVISRLEGVANSLAFDRRGLYSERTDSKPELRVRGLSTLYANTAPLLVVDNFPYEGDIANINPNDVESVTILKDAAAASIWGARAGNGVIVITTKRGRYHQTPQVSFQTNVQLTEKPDLHYNRSFLPATDFIDIERILFERGFYPENDRKTLSPAVETWIQERDGQLSAAEASARINAMRQVDVRDEALEHLYRPALHQQYALNLNGGSDTYRYYLSAGYDRGLSSLIGNEDRRVTLTSQNTIRPLPRLELTAGLTYTGREAEENGLGISGLSTAGWTNIYPYAQLADAEGNALPIVRDYRNAYISRAAEIGLLDWQFRPLEEIRLRDKTNTATETRLNGSLAYALLPGLKARALYQYQHQSNSTTDLNTVETYYARNLINRFTQPDGTRIIPLGGILSEWSGSQAAHSGRLQLDYTHEVGRQGYLSALGGAEVRQTRQISYPGAILYGYNPEVAQGQTMLDFRSFHKTLPSSGARIPAPSTQRKELTDRFLSYYANASYVFRDRYTLSASSRWDASNLYGVKTNQKGVPLWSAGLSWLMSEENFLQQDWLSQLKLRATYGLAGNTNKSVTAYPTISYVSADPLSRLPFAILRSAGNPQLRWEKTATLNTGIDFGFFRDRITGSLEYYRKQGTDLLGDVFIDPTSGIISGPNGFVRNRINYADVLTTGWDLALRSDNLSGAFGWQTHVLASHVQSQVTGYEERQLPAVSTNTYFFASPPPIVGKPIAAVYSYPWHGLSPESGDPLVPVDGQLGTNYSAYQQSLTPGDLVYHGSAMPTWFGSLRNTFTWKGFSLSANLTWKAGYFFRRSSIDYSQLINSGVAHVDYRDRWQQLGDEARTQVPSLPVSLNYSRESYHTYSEMLVEKGDHVRLQDVNLAYTFAARQQKALPFQQLKLFLYARDLGILWRANGYGLDPDYVNTTYPPARSLSAGLQLTF
ncbi:SusC/RagA family TonB-linked outer membrane protein [Pontibacter mangrovi]|uniref:SusC/RagA family TonB-linked outer membrane protein n=1 Tax=Pontibacter mangrovi TaxID=2589816 RepID=A0A501VXK1_9BACT|nr:SusC/RagA family TonB-linked outer membrane protein [Pontibacter mangrovi]TPE42453.1 SusC/RagA family TonB-linked outer membrane protein [Pontibacter mangrovi]